MRTLLNCLLLAAAVLPAQAQTVDICDRTPQVRDAILEALDVDDCAAVDSHDMAYLQRLPLGGKGLTTLRAGDFEGLSGLRELDLWENQLATLPVDLFDGVGRLRHLNLDRNQLTILPSGVFNGLHGPLALYLRDNQLTTLPAGVFPPNLRQLYLEDNRLRALPDGVFDGSHSLEWLNLQGNQLTSLPAGLFDDLHSLEVLYLIENQLTFLPVGVFDGLYELEVLSLPGNHLTTLPAGLFDGLVYDGVTRLQRLRLDSNRLTALPAGLFDNLASSLQILDLRNNHLVGLTRNASLFAVFLSGVDIRLSGQTGPLAAAVPLMLSAADSTRQGFVRIINESQESGSVHVFAFDDSGEAHDPIEIPLGTGQVVHFNSNDLAYGNADKGIERGLGSPVRGDWRLDIETDLTVRVLAFVRHGNGFLTAMHDVLPRDDNRLVARTFNPGSNMNQESRLRLVNTGTNDESVSIESVDDQGNDAGPVTLTLSAGESRTLSAFDLENGAQGLTGTLGDGAGKWRLFVDAGDSVVGMSLLESTNGGQLTNISTTGVANE